MKTPLPNVSFWLFVGLFAVLSGVPRAHAQMAEFQGSTESFFAPPTSVPSEPGALVRYQTYTDESGSPVPGVYRVLYTSTFLHTQGGTSTEIPIVTSGLVRIPQVAPSPEGFQTLAFTHGTLGLIDDCGTSRTGPLWESWMLSDTVKTVAADYPGLGFDSGLASSDAAYWSWHPWYPGLVKQYPFDETTHPYTNLAAEGRSTLDIVRAAQELEAALAGLTAPAGNVGTNPEFAVIGSSQGGHAALGTGEVMAEGYAPDLTLLAVLAGAPGSELQDLDSIDPALAKGFLPLVLVGASVSHADVHPADWMTRVGQANYERTTEEMCMGGGDAYTWWAANLLYSYPLNAPASQLAADPDYLSYALTNSPGYAPIEAPVLVGQIEGDPLVWRSRTDAMIDRLRTQPGIDLTYCVYDGNGASGSTTLALIERMENHLEVTSRLEDGIAASCVDETNQVVSSGFTAEAFLHQAGLLL